MIKLRKLHCSFCRKNESEVSKLVAGPRAYICDECVAIAKRIMESGDSNDPQSPKVSSARNLLGRVRQLWPGRGAQRFSALGNANC